MRSQCLFEKYFMRSLAENVTTASAGVGAIASTSDSGDFYAPGDARIPYSMFGGKFMARPGLEPKKKKKKKSKGRSPKKRK
jgi:hypothetical protein